MANYFVCLRLLLAEAFRNRAQACVQEMYDWNYVVDRYEDLFARMAGLPLPERDRSTAIETATDATHEKSLSRSASV